MHSITLLQNIHSTSEFSPTQDMIHWDCLKVEYYCEWRWLTTSHITITISQREHNAENLAVLSCTSTFDTWCWLCIPSLIAICQKPWKQFTTQTLDADQRQKKIQKHDESLISPSKLCLWRYKMKWKFHFKTTNWWKRGYFLRHSHRELEYQWLCTTNPCPITAAYWWWGFVNHTDSYHPVHRHRTHE